MTLKPYTFRTDNEQLQSFLDSQKEIASFLRQIVTDFMNGKLVYFDSKREQLKDQKLELEVKTGYLKMWKEIKEINKDLATKISPADLIAIMNGKMPASLAFITQNNKEEMSPYDDANKRLQCVDCLLIVETLPNATIYEKVNKYIEHVRQQHNRQLNETEKKVLGELIGVDKWE